MGNTETVEVIAVAQPSQGRRMLAFVALIFLGMVVSYVALFQDGSVRGKVVLICLGGMCLWGANHMRMATAGRVELTADGLRDGDGRVIVAVPDILRIERGTLAFKPSNGFMVHTKSSQRRGWRMGIWWRLGKYVGIGGMMPAHQTKVMAERLAELVEASR